MTDNVQTNEVPQDTTVKTEKEELQNLLGKIDSCVCHTNFISKNFKSTRENSLIVTKLQEAFMWAERLLDIVEDEK